VRNAGRVPETPEPSYGADASVPVTAE